MELTLRSARVRAGFPQEEVAVIMNCNVNTIRKLEKDSTNIKREVAERLARIYCVNPHDFYYGLESEFIQRLRESQAGFERLKELVN